VAADFERTKDDDLVAVDQAAISAAGYGIDSKGWLVPAEKRLSIRVDDEDEDSSLSSLPSDCEGEAGEDVNDGKPNRTSDVRLDMGNLAKRASPKEEDPGTGGSMEVDTPTSGTTLGEGVETDGYDEGETDGSEDGDDDSEDERPSKKRKRDATASRRH
jgi:hypothetical protein